MQYFSSIEQCGNTLLQLVNQILDLAKLESGTVELDRRACDLTDIARDVVVELNAVAEDRGVAIEIVDSGESSTVRRRP